MKTQNTVMKKVTRMTLSRQVACFFLLMWLGVSQAWAQQAGTLLFVRGNVQIVNEAGEARAGKRGGELREGDKVQTASRSAAQLQMNDDTLISLRANSEYLIEKQRYNKEDESLTEQAGRLFSGWMRAVSGAIAKQYPERVSYTSSVATIGVRGTAFQLMVLDEKQAAELGKQPGTYLYLEEGGIIISSAGGERLVKPGEIVMVDVNGGAPILVPEARTLFVSESEGFLAVVDSSDSETVDDLLNETVLEVLPVAVETPLDRVAGEMIVWDSYSWTAVRIKTTQQGMIWSGTGKDRVLTGFKGVYVDPFATSGGGTDVSFSHSGAVAHQGYGLLGDSEVFWGVWRDGSYSHTLDPLVSTPQGDLHYMFASNALSTVDALAASGPRGQVFYDYAGGTPLTSTLSPDLSILSGGIWVDFGLMNIDSVTLTLSDNVTVASSSPTPVSAFYADGVPLTDLSGQTFNSGTIRGQFVGSSASGIISTVEYQGGGESSWIGTASFERSSTSVPTIPQ